jgi:hypothetical protein
LSGEGVAFGFDLAEPLAVLRGFTAGRLDGWSVLSPVSSASAGWPSSVSGEGCGAGGFVTVMLRWCR